MLGRLVESFVTLFVVLDPIGSVPIFLNATARVEPALRKRVALIAVLVGSFVLMLFLYLGQYLLEQMHIGIPAFRIAGAAILFVFALHMIFGGHHEGSLAEFASHAGGNRGLPGRDARNRQPWRSVRRGAADR